MSKDTKSFCYTNFGSTVLDKIRADTSLAEDIRALDDASLFDWFAAHDPSATREQKPHVYLPWLCSKFTKSEHFKANDLEKIKTALILFDRYRDEFPVKDIAKYNTSSLMAAVAGYQGQLHLPASVNDEGLAKLQTSILYEGPAGSIIVPHTRFATDYWTDDCGWCVHSQKGGKFESYNQKGPLLLFLCNNSITKKQQKFLANANEDQEIANRWDDPIEPSDWSVIAKVIDEALEAKALSISSLVFAAGIPLQKIPQYETRMTEQDAFDIALFKSEYIDLIPREFLSTELCAGFVAKFPDKLALLPADTQTLRLKMLAASLNGAAYTKKTKDAENAFSAARFLIGRDAQAGWDDEGDEDYSLAHPSIKGLSGWPLPYIVSRDPKAILHLSLKQRTAQLISIALSNGDATLAAKVKIDENDKPLLYLSAISTQAQALKRVPEDVATEAFLIRAIHINPAVFKQIDEKKITPEIRMAHAEKTGEGTDEDTKKFVELLKKFSPTGKIADLDVAAAQAAVLEAMNGEMYKNTAAYRWLPQRLRSYEIYKCVMERGSVRDCPDDGIAPVEVFEAYPDLIMPSALGLLPIALRTEEFCLEALKVSSQTYSIPESLLQNRNFILKAIPIDPHIITRLKKDQVDVEMIELCLKHDPKTRQLWWMIPDNLWTDRYADLAANVGIETLNSYVPKRFHSYERVKTACRAHCSTYDVYWKKIPYDMWTLELADIVVLQDPIAISVNIANDKRPGIPREIFTPEYLIQLGQDFLALKGKTDEEKEGMKYYKGKYGSCPSRYFTTEGIQDGDNGGDHKKYSAAFLFAPHIQAIDPEGYAHYKAAVEAILQNYREGRGSSVYSFLDYVLESYRLPKAYCDAEMAFLLLNAERSFQRSPSPDPYFNFGNHKFFANFSPAVFTQELFDFCNEVYPGFFVRRKDGDKFSQTREIHPGYARFVKPHHIEFAKPHYREPFEDTFDGIVAPKTLDL